MSVKARPAPCLLLLCISFVWNPAGVAQGPDASNPTAGVTSSAPAQAGQSFDVVSIRPGKDVRNFGWQVDPDQFTAQENPLAFILIAAYYPMAYQRVAYESKAILQNAPDWIWKEPYDFRGKVASSDLAEWKRQREGFSQMAPMPMMQAMLQAALAERCKLVVHRTPGAIDGFALVVAKHEPNWKNLKKSVPGEKVPSIAIRLQIKEEARMIPIMPGEKEALVFFNTSMTTFATQLSGLVGAPVENRTRLDGSYDFDLERWRTETGFDWDVGALGLKLEHAKIPIQALVIDHIEKPSEN